MCTRPRMSCCDFDPRRSRLKDTCSWSLAPVARRACSSRGILHAGGSDVLRETHGGAGAGRDRAWLLTTEGDDPLGEAGSDGHKAVDAQTDRARPKEAASRDAWRRDARTKDVSSGEPTAPDGGVNEASADDASFGDAALDDASAEDAASYDATSGDASQGDRLGGSWIENDASTADAGDSEADASPAATTIFDLAAHPRAALLDGDPRLLRAVCVGRRTPSRSR